MPLGCLRLRGVDVRSGGRQVRHMQRRDMSARMCTKRVLVPADRVAVVRARLVLVRPEQATGAYEWAAGSWVLGIGR